MGGPKTIEDYCTWEAKKSLEAKKVQEDPQELRLKTGKPECWGTNGMDGLTSVEIEKV